MEIHSLHSALLTGCSCLKHYLLLSVHVFSIAMWNILTTSQCKKEKHSKHYKVLWKYVFVLCCDYCNHWTHSHTASPVWTNAASASKNWNWSKGNSSVIAPIISTSALGWYVKKRPQRRSNTDSDEKMLQIIPEEHSSGMIEITNDEDSLPLSCSNYLLH